MSVFHQMATMFLQDYLPAEFSEALWQRHLALCRRQAQAPCSCGDRLKSATANLNRCGPCLRTPLRKAHSCNGFTVAHAATYIDLQLWNTKMSAAEQHCGDAYLKRATEGSEHGTVHCRAPLRVYASLVRGRQQSR